MTDSLFPEVIPNWIGGEERPAQAGETFDKLSPHTGQRLARVARSRAADIEQAVSAARQAQADWADLPPVARGEKLHAFAMALRQHREEIARIVAVETGRGLQNALGETDGAISLGLFYAGEGQRLYGRTTTSGARDKYAMTVRQPIGVAGLIIAANTPIANAAWKSFPALICGNGAVLKGAEDTPATAWIFGRMAQEAGLPPGLLNVVQGLGEEAGAPLVQHPQVDVISFTGSTAVGRWIAAEAGRRLARISLELGGKNPFVVCDDADLDRAVKWAVLSAFGNAGQRCSSGSRFIVFDGVYAAFRERLVAAAERLTLGPTDEHDFGPVINAEQLEHMLGAVEAARQQGATVLTGGRRLDDAEHAGGYYMAPTLLEAAKPDDPISTEELFGPIAALYRVSNFQEALDLANRSPYGLTAAIHTRSLHRAWQFAQKVQAGVASINAGTFGSEPHMPFGGRKQSGNGSREPGTEALDIYSELKDIYLNIDPGQL